MTLRQVADATKLPLATLDLIEANQLDQLPRGLYARAHLRAYASAVSLPPEEVVSHYLAQWCGGVIEELPIAPPPPIEPPRRPARLLVTEVIAAALGVTVYVWLARAVESPAPLPVAVSVPDVRTSTTTETEAGAETTLAAGRLESGLRLEIEASGECWIAATADGERVIYRMLQAGDHVRVAARDELTLRVGDPEALTYWLNDKPGRPLGERRKPVTVRISVDDYESFLATTASARG